MKYIYYLGIDVGKSELAYCLREGQRVVDKGSFDNNASSIKTFFKKTIKAKRFTKTLICIEHTGLYNKPLLSYASEANLALWQESGTQINLCSGLHRGKSDQQDADRISLYAYRYHEMVRLYKPVSATIEKLKVLSKKRDSLIKVQHQLNTPLQEEEQFLPKEVYELAKTQMKAALDGIAKSLSSVEEAIAALFKADAELKDLLDLVNSVHGVGKITATKIIIYTEAFSKIDSAKKFACYVGTAPFSKQSGTSIKGRNKVHSFANKELKKLLHLCVMSCLSKKSDNVFKKYYEKKIKEGKHGMSAVNAVRNKMINVIFAVVRTKTKFDANFRQT